jgi:PPOX class probable FMN-dependent enzyme
VYDTIGCMNTVTTLQELEALYEAPVETSQLKVTDHVTPLQREYIDASPFVVLATVGANGVDCSPRGDPAGFVRVVDPATLQLPDRRGNNRLDSLRNIVTDGRVALLFLVPGIGVTLRINGTAVLRTDEALRATFEIDAKLPTTVIEVTVGECYTQCPKALIRSELWNAERFRTASELPTVGQINTQITNGAFDGAAYDAGYPERIRQTIY